MKKQFRPIALIIAFLSLLLLFVSCGNKLVSETYYSFANGSLDKSNYWTLNSDNTWTDSDGMAGTYDLNGTSITIYCFGTEFYSGTLENGKLSFGDLVYYLESKAPNASSGNETAKDASSDTSSLHVHSYNDWNMLQASTCTTEGMQARSCSCGDIQTETIPATGHNYIDKTCVSCGEIDTSISENNIIKTPEDLKKMINSKDNFALGNDIDLAGLDWTPIEGFEGTLMGNGFTIKNLSITAHVSNVGLFSILEGTVTNLKIENAVVSVSGVQEDIGILCGELTQQGHISDITVTGSVYAPNSGGVGGIVGYVKKLGDCTIKNLENKANVTGNNQVGGVVGSWGDDDYVSYDVTTITLSSLKNSGTIIGEDTEVGGIVGLLYCNNTSASQIVKIKDSLNSGDISGKYFVGGIIGYGRTDNWEHSVIENSACNANIIAEAYVGCIGGLLSNININYCDNSGSTLTATKYYLNEGEKEACVGGFVGRGSLVNNCTNTVEINYTSTGLYVGGIIGNIYYSGSTSMSNLKNTADITGYKYVGGIIGCRIDTSNSNNYTSTMTSFENTGKITAVDSYAGGIIGYLYAVSDSSYTTKLSISDFKNTGDVSGKLEVGGLIGYGETDSTESIIEYSSNKSNITAEAYVGCIAGDLTYIGISDCQNTGSTLTATKYWASEGEKYAFVGGFVGRGYIVKNCTNTVPINYTGGGRNVGGIAGSFGWVNGITIDNLANTANISGAAYVGGLIGSIHNSTESLYGDYSFNINNCTNSGSVTGIAEYVGGIIGYLNMTGSDYGAYTIEASELNNTGNITGDHYVGGIIGYGKTDSTSSFIQDSANTSVITAEHSVGCIAGYLSTIAIESCTNKNSTLIANGYYTENGKKYADIGGYVGRGFIANNCTNTVNINYTGGGSCVGGIAGALGSSSVYVKSRTISELHNTANIAGCSYVGGLVGCLYNYYDNWTIVNDYTINIEECTNSGSVIGTDTYVGGIMGYFHMKLADYYSFVIYGSQLSNNAPIMGNTYVGGVFGYCESDSKSSVLLDIINTGKVAGNKNVGEIAGEIISITIK